MIEPVLMESGSHIGPITATVIVAIGSSRRRLHRWRGGPRVSLAGAHDQVGRLQPHVSISPAARIAANGRNRRILPVALRHGEGLFTDPTTAVQRWSRERVHGRVGV